MRSVVQVYLGPPFILFTENCTEETRKSKTRETLCTHVMKFSSLKDFPKQIRIKRKYLTSQDEVPIRCRIGAEDSVRCAEADRDIVRYVDEADKADDGICSAALYEGTSKSSE